MSNRCTDLARTLVLCGCILWEFPVAAWSQDNSQGNHPAIRDENRRVSIDIVDLDRRVELVGGVEKSFDDKRVFLHASDRSILETCRPDRLAARYSPAGITGDQIQDPGEFLVEYRYMHASLDGNRVGTKKVADNEALAIGQSLNTNFGATPTGMSADIHVLRFMYGWSDNVTLYKSLQFPSLKMDYLRNTPFGALSGMPFTTQNEGFGDVGLGALWCVYECEHQELIVNLGSSFRTGDISNTTTEPTGLVPQDFSYPMRLGSGTFNLRPGVTYKKNLCQGSLGMQFQTDLPIGRSSDNYSVSDEFRLNTWYSHSLSEKLTLSLRLENLWKSNFEGRDTDLLRNFTSVNRPDMRGGYWLNLGYGFNWAFLCDQRIDLEVIHPIYQDLDGIQLEQDWSLVTSWSVAF